MRLNAFIDSHLHVLGTGYVHYNIDLNKACSIEEVIDLLKENQDREILIARGWNQENFKEKRFITKQDIDDANIEKPVILTRVCGHVLVVNSAMLEHAGIDESTPQIPGGEFSFKTGTFSEKAISLITNKLKKPSREDLRKYFLTANDILLENGITSVASDDFSTLDIDYEEVISVMLELYESNELIIRITEQVNLRYEKLKDFIAKGYVNKTFDKLRMGPLKILADGSLGGKTASLFEAYENESSNFGIKTYSDEELFELVHLADSNDMDVVIHAIGDAAVEQALQALIKSLRITKRDSHHHALIHAQLANRRQIDLMKEWRIGAIVQPIFLNSDIEIVEDRIGTRADESYLFKTMYNRGINVGFSTDSPIEPVNPFMNLYSAISRKSIKHDELGAFLPNESFQLEETLECYIDNNLPYVYQDRVSFNDHIVIDKELNDSNPKELLDVKILETYMDGVLVYGKVKK